MNDDNVLVSAEDLTKVYSAGELQVPALRGVTMDVRQGEFLSIVVDPRSHPNLAAQTRLADSP